MRTLFRNLTGSVPRAASLFIAVAILVPVKASSVTGQTLATDAPPSAQSSTQSSGAASSVVITLPAGTKVNLAITAPVWTRSAKAGDMIYAMTVFPVAINNQMAIPAGTYVQGIIDVMITPSGRSSQAEFQIHFTKLVFANGYAMDLPPGTAATDGTAIAMAYVSVSAASDVLLDNGSSLEMELRSPLALDADSVARAVRASKPVQFSQFKSATRCVPTSGTPGTPGSPDTVIPGTPATPDTVIPGGPGMPDTVIPGSPGTPPTVIPGTPGTPGSSGTVCPGPPVVSSTPGKNDSHKESLKLSSPTQIGGTTLQAGSYQVTWVGIAPTALVEITKGYDVVAHAQARITMLTTKAKKSDVGLRTDAGGAATISSLQFKGKTYALNFD